jgi:hypothetical protein
MLAALALVACSPPPRVYEGAYELSRELHEGTASATVTVWPGREGDTLVLEGIRPDVPLLAHHLNGDLDLVTDVYSAEWSAGTERTEVSGRGAISDGALSLSLTLVKVTIADGKATNDRVTWDFKGQRIGDGR